MFVSGGSTVLSSSENILRLYPRKPEVWASNVPQRQDTLFPGSANLQKAKTPD
jgi:hypothetical protein